MGICSDSESTEYSLSYKFFLLCDLPAPDIGDIAEFENCKLQICEFDGENQIWRGIVIE